MDPITVVLTSIVILLAGMVHGIAGFGYAQVSMGLLPLFRDPALASVIFTITAVVSNGRVFWSVKDDFRFKDWIVPVGGLIFGMPLGIYVFQNLNEQQLRLSIGVILIIAVVLIALMRQTEYVKEWVKEKEIEPGIPTGLTAGFLAGILGGAVAIPGPPMIVYGAFMVANEYWKGSRMKAVFTAFFGTLMAYRLSVLTYTGSVTAPLIGEALIAIPALFIGAWIGIKIFQNIPEKLFGWFVLVGLTVNAVILIVTSL
ncbi:MAG: sulfite exporter TauE/SafE family protein [Thermoplasmatota archaeon]